MSSTAYAQLDQLNQQTGIADPGRLERELTEDRIIPQVGPSVAVREMALINAPAGAENIKFKFGGIRLDGSQTYSKAELSSLYDGMIGTEISLTDLYAVANRMTLKYRNDGFVLTQVVVPPQTIDGGIVRLQVVEGFIDNITIQGEEESSYALNLIRQYASHISTGTAMNVADMERQLLLINDLPGVTARSVISPSTTTLGAADILIIVERDPFEAALGVNNYGSRFLGAFQTTGIAQFNSLFGLNDKITAQIIAAPNSGLELAFGSLGYEMPIGPHGTTVAVIGSITDTDPGFTLDQFDVNGLSRSLTIRAEHPIIRSRNTNLFGRLQFDTRNIESSNNIEATRRDNIRALRAGLRAEFLDRLLGVAVNSFDFQVSQGVEFFGASKAGDPNLTRAAGDPKFTKANIQIQRLQRLSNTVNIVLTGRGQLSNNPLLSSEEFGIGGIGNIRGFDPSEAIGDDGIAGSVEVQWKPVGPDVQLYSFLDSGRVWDQDATSSAGKRESLTSVGFGARLKLSMDIDAEFIATQPLHRNVETSNDRDPRFFFSFNKSF